MKDIFVSDSGEVAKTQNTKTVGKRGPIMKHNFTEQALIPISILFSCVVERTPQRNL